VRVSRWAAWAPGLEDTTGWERWARSPRPLGVEGTPDVRFLPPMLRRRCTHLTRLMLHAAFACTAPIAPATLPHVFASRHGEAHGTIELLQSLARDEPLPAMRFSHSVHNAQAGLFSIAAGNRSISSAIAGGVDTFPAAFLESLTVLQRAPEGAVLLVVGDEPLPQLFRRYVDDPQPPYALALVMERAAGGSCIVFGPASETLPSPSLPWPQALEFLRWLLSPQEPSLTLGARRRWRWSRAAPREETLQ
jgi:Beta-ketoacyl synthase, N-terminal domain